MRIGVQKQENRRARQRRSGIQQFSPRGPAGPNQARASGCRLSSAWLISRGRDDHLRRLGPLQSRYTVERRPEATASLRQGMTIESCGTIPDISGYLRLTPRSSSVAERQ